ncbi:MAG: class I SAM-dependent methyltransferase [Trebonia sp.]
MDQYRRRAGGEFGAQAELYDRARPGYPAEAVGRALPDPVGRLLDIGAGSGKLTVAVAHLADETIAVDPSEEMLARLRRHLPQVRTSVGTAEATGLPDRSVDAAVAGAAFHWFRRPAADAELARVLKPGGVLALLWNPVHPDDPVQRVFQAARVAAGLVPDEFDPTMTLDPRWFAATERADFTTIMPHTVDELIEQLSSRSYLLALDPPGRDGILGQARRRLAGLGAGGRARGPVPNHGAARGPPHPSRPDSSLVKPPVVLLPMSGSSVSLAGGRRGSCSGGSPEGPGRVGTGLYRWGLRMP